MRNSLLGIMCFLAIILVGFQVAGQYGRADNIEATVDINPETLNLNMRGQWITAHIELPEGYNMSDIDRESILLENIFRISWSNMEGKKLMVKFEADRVIEYLWTLFLHMGGCRGRIELTIKGQLKDGTQFIGMDTITIMDPINH